MSYRPRSISEVHRFLKSKSFSNEVITRVVNHLTEIKLLGDQEFTAWWVEARSRSKPSGPIKLKAELRQKGVPNEIINEFIKLNYRELAQKASRQQAAKLTEKDKRKRKLKLVAFLKRRGFTWSQINTALRHPL